MSNIKKSKVGKNVYERTNKVILHHSISQGGLGGKGIYKKHSNLDREV